MDEGLMTFFVALMMQFIKKSAGNKPFRRMWAAVVAQVTFPQMAL